MYYIWYDNDWNFVITGGISNHQYIRFMKNQVKLCIGN